MLRRISFLDNIIPKRVKFLVSALSHFVFLSVFILFWGEGGNFKTAGVLCLFSSLLFVYPILFGLKIGSFIRSLSVPLIFIFSSFYVLNYFPNLNVFFKLAFGVFSSFVYYFLLLSYNVFFVVEEKGSSIPLLRPARTAFLLIEIVALFLFLTSLYKFVLPEPLTEGTFLFQAVIIGFVTYYFVEQYWFSQNLEQEVISFVGNESLTISFMITISAISLSFFSTESFFRALALSTVFYVSITFFQSVVTHKLNRLQYIEYIVIFLIVICFLLIA